MTPPSLAADCQFCSVISKANGEDPIGSAQPCTGWMVMELPLPWTEERFHSDPLLQPIHDLFHELYDQGIQVAPMAIASDRDYSRPGQAHVFYYRRPDGAFAQFEKQTFLLPPDHIADLIQALLCQPGELDQFSIYQQPADHIRDIMVCTHGNVDIACARFGQPIYKQLREVYASVGARNAVKEWEPGRVNTSPPPSPPSSHSPSPLRVWRCSHFGGHQFAPTLVDFPTGQVWGHLEPHILETLIHRTGSVADLRPFYRGWSGLTRFEQMVEREIWMQRGWEWLRYHKGGCVLAQDANHQTGEADWADVRLEFADPHGFEAGAYDARVEVCGSVMTARNSGEAPSLAKQYRVSRLTPIA